MSKNITKSMTEAPHTTVKTAPLMKSVRYHGPGDIRVEQIDEPICGKGEVKIRPAFVGICGSDLHEYSDGPILIPQKPHRITGERWPVILGHEFGGIVEEVGEGVAHVSRGQKVVVRPTIVNYTCTACKMGYEYCCENIGFIGLSGYGGGMAKYTTAPANHFYSLPDKISLEAAALIEPLAVSWHAVNESPFKPNDNVLIIGGGPISVGTVQVLKLQGAKKIIVSEMMERRKEFSMHHGATHVLDPRVDDIPKQVHEITGGAGVDVAFDTAGVENAVNAAIDSCHAHGSIVNIAVWNRPPAIHVNSLMYQEMRYMGVTLYDEQSFMDVIRALQYGQLEPEDMITEKIKMDEVVQKGFEVLLGPERNDHCKILVDAQT